MGRRLSDVSISITDDGPLNSFQHRLGADKCAGVCSIPESTQTSLRQRQVTCACACACACTSLRWRQHPSAELARSQGAVESGHGFAMRHSTRQSRHLLRTTRRVPNTIGTWPAESVGKALFFYYYFPPHYFLTINKHLSPLVGVCRKCRQSPILLILLSPYYFQITNREPVLSAYPYSQLRPRPNRNTRLAQLWKGRRGRRR